MDYWGYTVALHLARNGIIPPKEWLHNDNIKDNYERSI